MTAPSIAADTTTAPTRTRVLLSPIEALLLPARKLRGPAVQQGGQAQQVCGFLKALCRLGLGHLAHRQAVLCAAPRRWATWLSESPSPRACAWPIHLSRRCSRASGVPVNALNVRAHWRHLKRCSPLAEPFLTSKELLQCGQARGAQLCVSTTAMD